MPPAMGLMLLLCAANPMEATVTITAESTALVHRVTQPGAQAKFPGILDYLGDWLVTAYSDQSDAFHEAGDTGHSFASPDGKTWSEVPNAVAPWILNGLVHSSASSSRALGFTYMLKGKPQVDAGSAYLQAFTLDASAAGVTQTSATNVTLTFPAGHQLDPYGNSTSAFGMVVTGCVVPLRSGGHLATLYGTYKADGAMSGAHYSLLAVKTTDGGRSWKWLSTVASHLTPGSPPECLMPSESSTVYLKNGSLFTVFRSEGTGSAPTQPSPPLCPALALTLYAAGVARAAVPDALSRRRRVLVAAASDGRPGRRGAQAAHAEERAHRPLHRSAWPVPLRRVGPADTLAVLQFCRCAQQARG